VEIKPALAISCAGDSVGDPSPPPSSEGEGDGIGGGFAEGTGVLGAEGDKEFDAGNEGEGGVPVAHDARRRADTIAAAKARPHRDSREDDIRLPRFFAGRLDEYTAYPQWRQVEPEYSETPPVARDNGPCPPTATRLTSSAPTSWVRAAVPSPLERRKHPGGSVAIWGSDEHERR